MFRKQARPLSELLGEYLRQEGLETPLLQKRLIDSWEKVAGKTVARYTGSKEIKNQTLYIKILNPALRQDLSMMRAQLVKRLNEEVGAFVIADVKIF